MSARGVLRFGADGYVLFWCPGCEGAHGLKIGEGAGPRWAWDGDADKPTFSPSVLSNGPGVRHVDGVPTCHSFVTGGRIQFLADSTHSLAGQTVDLKPF